MDYNFPEYREMALRYLGEEGCNQFMAARDQTFERLGWVRIAIQLKSAHVLDFGAGKFPSAWAKAQQTQR